MSDRVQFYSVSDLSIGWQLPRIESVMDKFNFWQEFDDINDIIELFSVYLILETNIHFREWNAENQFQSSDESKKILAVIGRFFNKITENSLHETLDRMDRQYSKMFWRLFEKYKVYNRVDELQFSKVLNQSEISLIDILTNKQLVEHYGNAIRNFLFDNIEYTKLLIEEHLELKSNISNRLFFPKQLTSEDKKNLVNRYIEWPGASINTLGLISVAKGTDLKIDGRMQLRAKKRQTEMIKDLPKTGALFEYGIEISFVPDETDIASYNKDGNVAVIQYDENWILENQDYPTLLQNFIYLFEFTDLHFRWLHISKLHMMGSFEKLIGTRGKREYTKGTIFDFIQILAQGQMQIYYKFLEKIGISFEDVIRWFFEVYLLEEFDVKGFVFNVSSKGSNLLEKCRNVAIEIDSILKQFRLYFDDDRIDRELFELSTESLAIQDIPSYIHNKYIYPNGTDIQKIFHLLFSDQSLMLYIKDESDQYHSSFEVLQNKIIRVDDLNEYQTQQVNWLSNKRILIINELNQITYDEKLLRLLFDLYSNDCSCLSYLQYYSECIQFLENHEMIRFGSSLLSEAEQNYFNYIINDSAYDNSLGLRNRYAHGNHSPKQEYMEKEYFIMLRILVLLIIKINEEFCLRK